MKSHKILKKVLLSAAAIVVLTTAIFAGTHGMRINGSSSHLDDLTELPTQQELQKELGFAPSVADEFSNGFTFKVATPGSGNIEAADGAVLESYRDLSVTYENGADLVTLHTSNAKTEQANPNAQTVEQGGLSFQCAAFTQKFVPVDYEKTQQDIQDEQNGKLSFGFGADEISVVNYQQVDWSQSGIHYRLFTESTTLTQADLITMALELMQA